MKCGIKLPIIAITDLYYPCGTHIRIVYQGAQSQSTLFEIYKSPYYPYRYRHYHRNHHHCHNS